jgi:hypothetical protein
MATFSVLRSVGSESACGLQYWDDNLLLVLLTKRLVWSVNRIISFK